MKRVALFCPGRGSYTATSLGSLDASNSLVQRAEKLRAGFGLPSLLELDGAAKFSAAKHLKPANVSPLIYLCSYLDARKAAEEDRLVCVGGNSMGWYTALAVAGVLSFDDGFKLVQQMSICQQEHAEAGNDGGQILYPLVDDNWVLDPERVAAVSKALLAAAGRAATSIHLGGYVVLAGTEGGIEILNAELPQLQMGKAVYPIRLLQHGPYHTVWQMAAAQKGDQLLQDLEFHAPKVTMIDGRGRRYTPWSADPAKLREYTFGPQVVTPYNFTVSVKAALREYAPDGIVLPGPGNSLGGICGQILVAEGYAGIRSKSAAIESKFIRSMRGADCKT
ncbi:MAG: [acyl-carrier-protein] S-malonyltransferase [Planctomycetota bacterium]|jgi:[acyl-carrier-protein] S-malonyltransferase